MGKLKWKPRPILIGCGCILVLDHLLMLMGALFIDRGIAAYDGAAVLGILSIVMAAFLSSAFQSLRFAQGLYPYLSALLFFMVMAIAAVLSDGRIFSIAAATKLFVALTAGCFIGSFVGRALKNRMKQGEKKGNYVKFRR